MNKLQKFVMKVFHLPEEEVVTRQVEIIQTERPIATLCAEISIPPEYDSDKELIAKLLAEKMMDKFNEYMVIQETEDYITGNIIYRGLLKVVNLNSIHNKI